MLKRDFQTKSGSAHSPQQNSTLQLGSPKHAPLPTGVSTFSSSFAQDRRGTFRRAPPQSEVKRMRKPISIFESPTNRAFTNIALYQRRGEGSHHSETNYELSLKEEMVSIVNQRMKGVEERVRRLQKELAEVKGKYSQEQVTVRSTLKALKKKLDDHIHFSQDTHKHEITPLWHSEKKLGQDASFLRNDSPFLSEIKRNTNSPSEKALIGDDTLREIPVKRRGRTEVSLNFTEGEELLSHPPNISTPTFSSMGGGQGLRAIMKRPSSATAHSSKKRKSPSPMSTSSILKRKTNENRTVSSFRHKQALSWEEAKSKPFILSKNVSFNTEATPLVSPPNKFSISQKLVQPLHYRGVENRSFAKGDTGSPQLEELTSDKDKGELLRTNPGVSVQTPFDPEEVKDKIGILGSPGITHSFVLDTRALSSKTGNRSTLSDDRSDSLRLQVLDLALPSFRRESDTKEDEQDDQVSKKEDLTDGYESETSRKSPFSTLSKESQKLWHSLKKPKLMGTLNYKEKLSRTPQELLNKTYSLDQISPRLIADRRSTHKSSQSRFSLIENAPKNPPSQLCQGISPESPLMSHRVSELLQEAEWKENQTEESKAQSFREIHDDVDTWGVSGFNLGEEEDVNEEGQALGAEEGRARELRNMSRHDSLSPGHHPHTARTNLTHMSFDLSRSSPPLFGMSPVSFLQSTARRALHNKVPVCKCKPVLNRSESRVGLADDKSSLNALLTEGTDERADSEERKPASSSHRTTPINSRRPHSSLGRTPPRSSPILPCSDYCVNLPPRRQRTLIHNVFRSEAKGLAGAPTSVRNKRFLVCANWWRRWKDYVEYEGASGGLPSTEDLNPEIILGGKQVGSPMPENIDSRGLEYAQLIQNLKLKRPLVPGMTSPHHSQLDNANAEYEHPGTISNKQVAANSRSLLSPNSVSQLRHPLLEHYDFEALSSTMWRYLKSWYGCDLTITRLLIRDKSNPTKYILDLYPRYRKTPPQTRSQKSQGA